MKGAACPPMILMPSSKFSIALFAVALLMQTVGDLAIGLGHTEPVTVAAKVIERLVCKITADRIFAQLAVDAGARAMWIVP